MILCAMRCVLMFRTHKTGFESMGYGPIWFAFTKLQKKTGKDIKRQKKTERARKRQKKTKRDKNRQKEFDPAHVKSCQVMLQHAGQWSFNCGQWHHSFQGSGTAQKPCIQ